MKILTIVVPCYNSQDYIKRCVNSLLPGGKDVEILIINDGSTDRTAEIANEYEAQYADIIRVVHQENGGHGAAVNTGIKNATGTFIKVVDSDDWVDRDAYTQILQTLTQFSENDCPDILLSNFVYEKDGKERKTVMRYANILPENRIFTWDDIGRFRKGKYILMHSIIYRTELLRECGLELPRHTFYVDNLYAYIPLKHVNRLYYIDVDFYRYYIGREDQSVQENTMIKRIDQQLYVNKLMASAMSLEEIPEKCKRNYMFHYLEIVTMISSIMLIRSGTEENLHKKRELWRFIKQQDKWLYNKLRYGFLGQLVNLPGYAGRSISLTAYKMSQKVVGFN